MKAKETKAEMPLFIMLPQRFIKEQNMYMYYLFKTIQGKSAAVLDVNKGAPAPVHSPRSQVKQMGYFKRNCCQVQAHSAR